MCGIISFYSNKNVINKEQISNGIKILNHRGPDGYDIWLSDSEMVALAHARLAIVDLKYGQQPLKSIDNKIIAIVNGEFYDYKAIKNSMLNKGYVFRTESDSEILLSLYQAYGLKLFEYLNGEFSFVLFDSEKNQLIAARDRFGIKPLYYSWDNSNLYIASEAKALFQMGLKAQWNNEVLVNYLHGIPLQNPSCFKSIDLVKPGHYIFASTRGVVQKKYWDLKFKPDYNMKFDDAVNEFDNLFEQAVQKRLIADVPVACYLSGGIDSSSVLAHAVKEQSNIIALTISFDDNAANNELQYATTVAKYLDVDLLTLKITQDDLANSFKKAIYHREAPVYQSSGVAKLLLSEFTNKNGIKSVLTGEGADEFLVGYPSLIEDFIFEHGKDHNKEILFRKLINSSKQTASTAYVSGETYAELDLYNKILGYEPSFLKLSCQIANYSNLIMSEDFKNIVGKQQPYKNFLMSHEKNLIDIEGNVNKSIYLWVKSYFPEMILSFLGDRMEMANSVEGRLPFLDNQLISFLSKVPLALKISHKDGDKNILRSAMQNQLPEHIRNRKKHIFSSPPICNNDSRNLAFYKLMLEVFNSPQFNHLPFFNQKEVIKLLEKLPSLNVRSAMIAEFTLNLALSLFFLQEHFVK